MARSAGPRCLSRGKITYLVHLPPGKITRLRAGSPATAQARGVAGSCRCPCLCRCRCRSSGCFHDVLRPPFVFDTLFCDAVFDSIEPRYGHCPSVRAESDSPGRPALRPQRRFEQVSACTPSWTAARKKSSLKVPTPPRRQCALTDQERQDLVQWTLRDPP